MEGIEIKRTSRLPRALFMAAGENVTITLHLVDTYGLTPGVLCQLLIDSLLHDNACALAVIFYFSTHELSDRVSLKTLDLNFKNARGDLNWKYWQ